MQWELIVILGTGYIVWCTRAVLDGIEALSITVQSKDHSAVRFSSFVDTQRDHKVIACSFAVAERVYILRAVQCVQDFLASRIEAFLSDFSDHLKTLDPDVFHSHVTSLVARYRESDKNIGALQEAVDKEWPPLPPPPRL
eukprot:COSAG02_NODE_22985_length_733_cov_1.070978_1_plen_140_part_00